MMPNPRRMTNIVATLGPATQSEQMVDRLIRAGVNVFRMNFSHGEPDWHRRLMHTVRERAEAAGVAVAVMQDLQGPRLRTGRVQDGREIVLQDGADVRIAPGDFAGTPARIATDYQYMPRDVRPGRRILLSDGLIELEVVRVEGQDVCCRVVSGGALRANQGINLPGVDLSIVPPTGKDIDDLRLGLECGVDYVALSFVGQSSELHRLREEITRWDPEAAPGVVAKIERPQALDNLPSILRAADAVMVARGDLGIEMGPEDVPAIQKHIIRSANSLAIPVITATQMLDSMIGNPRPTRAETSDVANAILDGSDAVMLSGETAIGRFPVETVEMMAKIAVRAEAIDPAGDRTATDGADRAPVAHSQSLAAAAGRIARDIGAGGIVVFTMSGATARYVARQRVRLPVYALTPRPATYRKLALVRGVTPLPFPLLDSTDDMLAAGRETMLRSELVAAGDTLVCLAGPSTQTPGGADMLKLLHC